jgi:hypothetical protein
MRGPRALDVDGLPLHRDNQTIVKERLFLDKANRPRRLPGRCGTCGRIARRFIRGKCDHA